MHKQEGSQLSRRSFLKAAGAVAAGTTLTGAPAPGVAGANEKIGLGFIGVGGRGSFHLRQFKDMDDVAIVAVALVFAYEVYAVGREFGAW